ncbi:hypothetical protein Micbo1qcDRAFT_175936 [Microdochium bolleyi]|uniref:Uncharacterized protein n=1 Tax=Microdochium bolleyi TaxID=196109 RepID=A0A136J1I7_9PEZI|nr:hypothetical protein Micbo1qcDRAFT_175936 [Microdochium bolleyi]
MTGTQHTSQSQSPTICVREHVVQASSPSGRSEAAAGPTRLQHPCGRVGRTLKVESSLASENRAPALQTSRPAALGSRRAHVSPSTEKTRTWTPCSLDTDRRPRDEIVSAGRGRQLQGMFGSAMSREEFGRESTSTWSHHFRLSSPVQKARWTGGSLLPRPRLQQDLDRHLDPFVRSIAIRVSTGK